MLLCRQVNTLTIDFDSKGINHTEGGWPKDINHLDVEQVVRYRKKAEKDFSYLSVMGGLGSVIYLARCIVTLYLENKTFIDRATWADAYLLLKYFISLYRYPFPSQL